MKCRGSSETRFPKVWGRTEPSSGGKRPFEVSKTFFDVETWNVGNRPKRVLAKFGGIPSLVWGVNGDSKIAQKLRNWESHFSFNLSYIRSALYQCQCQCQKHEKRILPLFGEFRKNASLAVEYHQDQAASEAFLLNSPKSGKIRFSFFFSFRLVRPSVRRLIYYGSLTLAVRFG